jgi:tetratricopeptide (TPR) repeat protein
VTSECVQGQFDFAGEMSLWKKRIAEGNAAYFDRRYSKAEIRFSEALKQAESWPKDLPIDQKHELESCLSKSQNNLAALYHSQGKYLLAEQLYLQSLEIKKRILGDENTEVALNLQNLAACYCARGRYEEAEQLFKQSIKIRENLLGENHPDLLTTLENYALLLRKLKREQEAQEVEARAALLMEFKS